MKVSFYVICFFGAIVCNVASPLQGEPMIDVDALSKMTMQEIDALASGLAAEELIRTKRSGSGDILGSVGKVISSGVSNKLAFIGQASAGASALFSGGSSKHHAPEGYSYGPPPMEYHMKSFDFLSLKKSILNTLLQAVKAITGGVTILKGQIIKGGGALVSGVGKLVTTKGEVVTNLGRRIVNSASLVPPKKKIYAHPAPIIAHPSPSAIAHPISSYGPPTAPAYHYAPPTAPSIHYGPPIHHEIAAAGPVYGPPIGHNSIYGGNKFTSAFEDNFAAYNLHW